MSVPPPSTSSNSRSRTQARKKPNDDASYFGPPSGNTAAGTKRHATDALKGEGEPRAKRKKVDTSSLVTAGNRRADRDRPIVDGTSKISMVNFDKMPTAMLYRYLTQYDLLPTVYPSPLSADDPPPPSSLNDPARSASQAPTPPPLTPANRPRRESREQSRRRSSRLVEDTCCRTPILADVEDIHGVLAGIAEQHFREESTANRSEVDILASFMCAVEKSKGGKQVLGSESYGLYNARIRV